MSYSGPMLEIGYFKSILHQSEKMGGKSFASSSNPSGLQLFMDQNALADLGYSSPKFTWSNKRLGRGEIRKRMDRGIANSQWTLLFPHAKIIHLLVNSSDHAPLLLNTSWSENSPKPFKSEESWARELGSLEFVKKAWNLPFHGSPAYNSYN